MRLSLQGWFDVGQSFGVDDEPFTHAEQVEEFKVKTGLTAMFPSRKLNWGLSNPLGSGFWINLDDSNFVSLLKQTSAREVEAKPFICHQFNVSDLQNQACPNYELH